jgi:beta-glucosidase
VEEFYSEGLDIGYRWYAAHQLVPAYPFGYGLSYTHFRYSDIRLASVGHGAGTVATVSVRVTNAGKRGGRAVPELFLALPATPSRAEPPIQLAGFQGVNLQPGQSALVTFHLDARSFGYYSESANAWQVASGCTRVAVGSSAVSLPLRGRFAHRAKCGPHAVALTIDRRAANRADVLPAQPAVRR